MPTSGMVFDIKELAVHDGPGIRTTVFLKGCPLHCIWCHNPEGQSSQPQTMTSPVGKREVGQSYTSEALAKQINSQAEILRMNKGGVTFSGGEPLMQSVFVAEVIDQLDNLHVLLDTSGYADEKDLRRVVSKSHLVHYDLKLVDKTAHLKYTGVENDIILSNLRVVGELGKDFIIRVPLVPGITDTDANLKAIAETVQGLSGLREVNLLPYNKAAGAKYKACGKKFEIGFDPAKPVNANTSIFEAVNLKVKVT